MRKLLILLCAVGFTVLLCPSVRADPASDLRQLREYFRTKFPTVPFDAYADGIYALPGMETYRSQWDSYNEFPPYVLGLDKGKKMWLTPFADGATFAGCFRHGGVDIAQHYPYWDRATHRVRTAEMDLMQCATRNGAHFAFLTADLDRDRRARVELADLTAYFYALSAGQRVSIDLSSPGAVAAYERGKEIWWARRGQLNFSCASCHLQLAGKNLGGNQPVSAALGHPVGWPAQRLAWGRLETIDFRYRTCLLQMRAKPFAYGGAADNDLQLYETYLSTGLPLRAPSMRN